MTQAFIVGCGYSGRRIGKALSDRGGTLPALVRAQDSAAGIRAIADGAGLPRPPVIGMAEAGASRPSCLGDDA